MLQWHQPCPLQRVQKSCPWETRQKCLLLVAGSVLNDECRWQRLEKHKPNGISHSLLPKSRTLPVQPSSSFSSFSFASSCCNPRLHRPVRSGLPSDAKAECQANPQLRRSCCQP